jgi:hypothetical protein
VRVGARQGEKGVVTIDQHAALTIRLARLRRIVRALQAVNACQTDRELNAALEALRTASKTP